MYNNLEKLFFSIALLACCISVIPGPKAIGVFHVALSSQYLHLFNYLSQLFMQAGINLPANRQVKGGDRDWRVEIWVRHLRGILGW